MPHTNFGKGIYVIANSKTPSLVLDTKDGKAIVNQFMGTESQQWEISKVVGLAWSVRSISTGRYLGMKPNDKVTNHYELWEVEHPFPWHFRRESPETRIKMFVPYSNHAIDLNQANGPKPGTVLSIYEKHEGLHQQWILCEDLHLATSKALVHGSNYRIINSQSKTAIEMDGSKVACFKSDEAKDCQKKNGWAFRHVASQDYLGLPNSVLPLSDGVPLCSVKKEFTWVALPHHEDTSKFRIWVPFTFKVMDLHCGSNKDDTPIRLFPERSFECQWWHFKLIQCS
ncbi:hypothetical protein BKA70DRAFT_1343721 [Coprinopsis sp. MPI-PUGE-AT-0042]|nr:hypothetical protein BKA70DRAFT_1343721 [Coprinopsis sp. MPI-PUGE-AT-0042]